MAAVPVRAETFDDPMPTLSEMSGLLQRIDEESPETMAKPIKILLLLTLLSIVPAVLMLTTAFTRIVIVLAFIRRALTTRNIPPNQVVVGLALFLSLFVMAPTMRKINARGIQPYLRGELSADQAVSEGVQPLREFMFGQTRESDLALFMGMSGLEQPETEEDVPTYVLIPSFIISELRRAFELGFVLFLPFLVVDLVVASVLLSMGMIMLPPVMISAPLKILLFVLVDGWRLISESLVFSFGGG
jgi:flagellar biosynthetic protein FliP